MRLICGLEEHISNYNGHLLSNLTGEPAIPPKSSNISIPTDLGYKLYLAESYPCTSGRYYYSDAMLSCRKVSAIAGDLKYGYFTFDNPYGGWEMVIYDGDTCTDKPLQTKPDLPSETCYYFPAHLLSPISSQNTTIAIRPLWNAAYIE